MKILVKTKWVDFFNPVKQMVEVEKSLMMPPKQILMENKSTYSIGYNEIKSLRFSKDPIEIHMSFLAHNRRFSFSFPSTQHRTANRLRKIYSRYSQKNICPKCKGKLVMGENSIGFCNDCNMNYKMNISDLRYDFQNEVRKKTAFRNKSTGALLAIFGTIFFFAIYYTFYLLDNTPGFSFSENMNWIGGIKLPLGVMVPCFFIFPVFIITTGVLVYSGTISGKIMFGVLCILFGLACNLAGLLLIFNEEEGARAFDIILSSVGCAIIGYGILLIRSSLKSPRIHLRPQNS
jgi:hypothetical protein